MIHVTYDGNYALTVVGHAGQAPAGQDIVCAGVSALVGSLAKMLQQNRDQCQRLGILLEQGCGRITVQPSSEFEEGCRRAFETVLCGLEQIVEQYPSYIRLEKVM